MTVRRRSDTGSYFYDFTIDGKRYREVAPHATRAQAKEAERTTIKAVLDKEHGGRKRASLTLADFIKEVFLPFAKEHYKSYLPVASRAVNLGHWLGCHRLDQLSPSHLEGYRRQRREAKAKASTVNGEIRLLRRMLNLAAEQGVIRANTLRIPRPLKEEPARKPCLNPEEEVRLLAACRDELAYLRPIVELALVTGMRRSELHGLSWESIDWFRKTITLTVTKNGRSRVIPLSERAREILRELSLAPSGAVFVNEKGRPRRFDQKHWDRAKQRAGLPDLHFHDLRHTAASRLLHSGVHPFTISDLLGHSSVQMTAHYAHSTGEVMQWAVEMLGNYRIRHGQGTDDQTGMPEEGALPLRA